MAVDFDDSVGDSARRFLRKIVTHALDDSMRAFAGELHGAGCPIGSRRDAIGIAVKGDGRHSDNRAVGKSLSQVVVLRVAFSQAQPPAVVMDHDPDVVRVVEGRCGAVERGIIEVPSR